MAEAKPIAHLDFEKPLAELEKRIEELRKLSGKQKLGAEAEITSLQKKWASARQEVYGNLTPWQRIQIVRHPQRPYLLDYLRQGATELFELGGIALLVRTEPSSVVLPPSTTNAWSFSGTKKAAIPKKT